MCLDPDCDHPELPDATGLTCIHDADGLCEACYADYCDDPLAWLEYGDHPEGIANKKRFDEEMAAFLAEEAARPRASVPDDLPF